MDERVGIHRAIAPVLLSDSRRWGKKPLLDAESLALGAVDATRRQFVEVPELANEIVWHLLLYTGTTNWQERFVTAPAESNAGQLTADGEERDRDARRCGGRGRARRCR